MRVRLQLEEVVFLNSLRQDFLGYLVVLKELLSVQMQLSFDLELLGRQIKDLVFCALGSVHAVLLLILKLITLLGLYFVNPIFAQAVLI